MKTSGALFFRHNSPLYALCMFDRQSGGVRKIAPYEARSPLIFKISTHKKLTS